MTKNLLIIGGKSDIGQAIAKKFISKGYNIILAGRNMENTNTNSIDICSLKNTVITKINFDICDFKNHKKFYKNLHVKPDGVVIASGYMVEQNIAENDMYETLNTINVNYAGPAILLNIIASEMEKIGDGFIIGISSVAGERGRKSNYIYGSSKSSFTSYLSGLRSRLYQSGIHVLTVNPGFVKTAMTKNLKLPYYLTTSPEIVADKIYKAVKNKKDIIYIKSIWKVIMIIIKLLPEKIFKKINL